ncbi:hypothetical protein [Mycobacteroides franklinii]|nr:hypothetical protein [Mycobacteroides franklinii]ORA59210.1 hypothetical protein BST24_17795 [Mycobacteroides franklinii]
MRRGLPCVALVVVMGGCGQASEPRPIDPGPVRPSNVELARFLPVLADYPGPSWDVTLTAGASDWIPGPYIGPNTTVEPSGCADIPFQRSDLVAASSAGVVQNGIAGNAGEAAVRIMRDRLGTDLIADSVAWAERCHQYRETYSGATPGDPSMGSPTAVSVLPPRNLEGVEVTRIHLTDNRDHRDQGEGTRESVISLARVRGVVVVGYRHDRAGEADAILATTIRRLSSDRPASRPLSDKADASALTTRTDKDLEQLLPSIVDTPAGWTVLQSSPIVPYSTEDGESATGCSRLPFADEVGNRSDSHRNFRKIASVSMSRKAGKDTYSTDTVTLGLEHSGSSVIDETIKWANQCHFASVPAPQLDGINITSFHIPGDRTGTNGRTVSLLRVRGLLVIAEPAFSQQDTQLMRQSVENLRHAKFETRATGPDSMPIPSEPTAPAPGDVKFPQPTADATVKLARVAQGALVDPGPFHVGGYLPEDSPTASSPDYLHFRSPTGAIMCTWRKYILVCDVPRGTYPRTPKPVDLLGNWQDSVTTFGFESLQNGIVAPDPVVYAVSNVLAYGSTIRLTDDTECRMDTGGLTCVEYGKDIGFHLSRTDLTPLAATSALINDTRPQPH